MWNFFAAGGVGMYLTGGFGLTLLIVCGLDAFRPPRQYTHVSILLAIVTSTSGLLGLAAGMMETFRYVSTLPPAQQLTTLFVGAGESLHNLVFGGIFLVLAGLVAVIGMFRQGDGTIAKAS